MNDLNQTLEALSARKDDWVQVDLKQRIAYLDSAMERLLQVAPHWVEEANRLRRIDPASPVTGEEWISGPVVILRQLRQLRRNLLALDRTGKPVPVPLRQGQEGRWIATVLPGSPVDRLMYLYHRAELWTAPGEQPTRAKTYRNKPDRGKLALVLGAGNISSIAPLDVIHKLMVEDQVALLKMNPVNDFLEPYLQDGFRDLIDDGFLAIVSGDGGIGSALVRHPLVDTVHLTGSKQTYEAIRSDKPITAELGCVTPILVVPGKWSRSNLKHQARNIAGMVTHNASFNCNAGKVLLLDRGWNQRDALLDEIKSVLAAAPQRYPYYPGANERYARYLQEYPAAIKLGEAGSSTIPWTFIPGVKPDPGEYALRNEPFCGVLSEVTLDGTGDPAAYLNNAVRFANEAIEGDLACMVITDGTTPVGQAVHDLRYGGIGVNTWAGMNFGLGNTHWGAAPGNTPESIGSGFGSVHNTFLFDNPEKSVVYAPFRAWPKPVWFPDHRTLKALGPALARYECTGTLATLIRVVFAAMRG